MTDPTSSRSSILDEPPPSADRRIAYGDAPSQFGDLYLPSGSIRRRAPLVILLHGGYWRARYGLGYFGHVAAALADLLGAGRGSQGRQEPQGRGGHHQADECFAGGHDARKRRRRRSLEPQVRARGACTSPPLPPCPSCVVVVIVRFRRLCRSSIACLVFLPATLALTSFRVG